jgi:hypothetical protein
MQGVQVGRRAAAPARPSSEAMGRLKGEPPGGCSGDAGARTVSAAMA